MLIQQFSDVLSSEMLTLCLHTACGNFQFVGRRQSVATGLVSVSVVKELLSVCQVYYVDDGFSVETSGNNLLELHQDFLSLPFQAISVGLAGTLSIYT